MPLIVADANIPLAQEAFSPFGEVRLLPGRAIARADLAGADALIVRSVTRVTRELLEGTPVRFAGTATIGTDHLDIPGLAALGIPWESAAGCNARSVVEWVMAGLIEYCLAQRADLADIALGIVGHGNTGSRLAVVARSLGMKVRVCDPPLHREGKLPEALSLEEVLSESDAVTFHVPYTRDGPDATHHMISWDQLDLLRPRAAFLNSSRGAVLDNAAALAYARSDASVFLLDVFENEPRPNRDMCRFALLSTPHIAGYSHEGKVNGTRMMAEALARHLGARSTWVPVLAQPEPNHIILRPARRMLALQEAVRASYDIVADSNRLREGLEIEDDAAWGQHFDNLRKNYHQRREFANYTVALRQEDPLLRSQLTALGFVVEPSPP